MRVEDYFDIAPNPLTAIPELWAYCENFSGGEFRPMANDNGSNGKTGPLDRLDGARGLVTMIATDDTLTVEQRVLCTFETQIDTLVFPTLQRREQASYAIEAFATIFRDGRLSGDNRLIMAELSKTVVACREAAGAIPQLSKSDIKRAWVPRLNGNNPRWSSVLAEGMIDFLLAADELPQSIAPNGTVLTTKGRIFSREQVAEMMRPSWADPQFLRE